MIDTKRVQGRRRVRYESFEELVAEAEKLSRVSVRTLGNWSLGRILKHLAIGLNTAIDGSPFRVPAPMRLIFTLFFKKKFLSDTLPAGFQIPKDVAARMVPDETSVDEGLSALREAVARYRRDPSRAPHPAFGKLSSEELERFHLRHAEMHMSFVIPGAA